MNKLPNKKVEKLMAEAQANKVQGNLLEAKIILKKVIKLDSRNEIALNNIGNIYKEMKDFDQLNTI